MVQIHSSYIESAIRIRREFLDNVELLKSREESVTMHNTDIKNIMESAKATALELGDNMTSNKTREELNRMLVDMETSMDKIRDEIAPITDRIGELNTESKRLYDNIKDSYPMLGEDDIREQITVELINLNLI